MRFNKFCKFLWAALAILITACTSMPNSYEQAKQFSDDQKLVMINWLKNNPVKPHVFNIDFSSCINKVPKNNLNTIEVVAKLNKDGDVAEVFTQSKTQIERCVSSSILKQKFPKPPFSPAFILIVFDFTLPEPKVSSEPFIKDVLN